MQTQRAPALLQIVLLLLAPPTIPAHAVGALPCMAAPTAEGPVALERVTIRAELEGTLARTRIDIVFGDRARTVSIAYTEPLAMRGAQAIYRLPLDYGATVGEFSIAIVARGAASGMRISGARDLTFARSGGNEVRAERRDFEPRGELEVAVTSGSSRLEAPRTRPAHVVLAPLLAPLQDLAPLLVARRVPVADLA